MDIVRCGSGSAISGYIRSFPIRKWFWVGAALVQVAMLIAILAAALTLPPAAASMVVVGCLLAVIFVLLGISEAGVLLGRKTYLIDRVDAKVRPTYVAFAALGIGCLRSDHYNGKHAWTQMTVITDARRRIDATRCHPPWGNICIRATSMLKDGGPQHITPAQRRYTMKMVQLHHWPYAIFRSSRTPPGLYARQKWLQEGSSPLWKADFDATVSDLFRGQSHDGLWSGSPIKTIHRLFGLHLTVRTSNPAVHKSLDALLDIEPVIRWAEITTPMSEERLRGLPFAPAGRQFVVLPAALFLAAIFGRASDPTVLERYDRIAADMAATPLVNKDPAALHNILRAFVVHPDYHAHAATGLLVAWLADRQTRQGDWGPDIPFYQALNALAHLDHPVADRQSERAFVHLTQRQHSDGAWGEKDRQWCTFLAVHALRNKGQI